MKEKILYVWDLLIRVSKILVKLDELFVLIKSWFDGDMIDDDEIEGE